MKRRISLSTKILLLALVNVVLVVMVFLSFAQFRFDIGSFLLGLAHERVVSVSRLAALDLNHTPREQWTKVLDDFSQRYPARLYLFGNDASEIAGPPVKLPDLVAIDVRRPSEPRRPRPPADSPPLPPPRPPEPPQHQEPFPRGAGIGPPLHFIHAGQPPETWVAVPVPIWRLNENGERRPAILVWRIRSLWTDSFYFDLRSWLLILAATLLIPAACWIPFVRRVSHTISNITGATSQIADGHFDVKLSTSRGDELGVLSDSINRMAARLAGYVNGQKRFLGDIAHELSSPIARMQMALGILEQRVSTAQESYVSDVNDELQHISALVNELLQFSRAALARREIRFEPVPLVPVLQRAIEREGSPAHGIEFDVPENLAVMADTDCVFRAISNVLRNAIRYAGDYGAISVKAARSGENIAITVADCGPGLPESELEHVFRPFYRPEFARTRETGGTGLGLAIVRDCVESCGGRVECQNRSPRGLEVTIELPAV